MSNTYRLHPEHENINEWLSISNTGTTVLLTVLGLSGSRIAQSSKEKELIIWLVEHDQIVRGFGNVGFDISDIPWSYTNFEYEKEFFIKVIDGAKQKLGWETLDYKPNVEIIFPFLDTLRKMINVFEYYYINKEAYSSWLKESEDQRFSIPKDFPVCEKHGILLYWHGCIGCNNK